MRSNSRLHKPITIIMLALVLILASGQLAIAEDSGAADPDDRLYIKGTFDYDRAYEVLNLVNAERSKHGVGSLRMDESLLESAMIRAAESALYFEHTRPNGEICFSINEKMSGENIAKGTSSSQRAVKAWMNSAGHRENILRSEFKSIGIGVFEYNGGYYWAQSFSRQGSSGAEEHENVIGSAPIDLPESNYLGLEYTLLHGDEEGDVMMEVGESTPLTLTAGDIRFDSAKMRWIISDPEVAEADENGILTIKGMGRAIITAASGNIERASFEVTAVTNINSLFIAEAYGKGSELGVRTLIEDNREVKPEVIVLGRDGPLTEGIDYSVTYEDNKKTGSAKVIVRGRGSYIGSAVLPFEIKEAA